MNKEKDVHTEHCCFDHGCKYGDDDCPVTSGKKEQSFPCETCDFAGRQDFAAVGRVIKMIREGKNPELLTKLYRETMERQPVIYQNIGPWDDADDDKVFEDVMLY